MSDSEITPAELYERIRSGEPVRVVDIRDREAVEQWRITGDSVAFTSLPRAKALQAKALGTVDDLLADVAGEGPITVVCAEGRSSAEVAAHFREAGADARNLADGMESWADLYVAAPVETDGSAAVIQYQRPSSGCLGYMLVSEDEAAVIDPLRAFTDRYVEDAAARDATLTAAIDTHVHADHISGVTALSAETDATAVVPAGAVERGMDVDAETVTDGDALAVGDVELEAVHAPGHTTDMTAFAAAGVLFSGDSLFVESVARPDLETDAAGVPAFAAELYATLTERFDRFDDGTILAPAHHSDAAERRADGTFTATLGELRDRLGVFGMDEASFVEYVQADMPPRPANFEAIIEINLGRSAVETAEALELELGPNNCAASPAD